MKQDLEEREKQRIKHKEVTSPKVKEILKAKPLYMQKVEKFEQQNDTEEKDRQKLLKKRKDGQKQIALNELSQHQKKYKDEVEKRQVLREKKLLEDQEEKQKHFEKVYTEFEKKYPKPTARVEDIDYFEMEAQMAIQKAH